MVHILMSVPTFEYSEGNFEIFFGDFNDCNVHLPSTNFNALINVRRTLNAMLALMEVISNKFGGEEKFSTPESKSCKGREGWITLYKKIHEDQLSEELSPIEDKESEEIGE